MKRLPAYIAAFLLAGCGSSGNVTTEILDKSAVAEIPEKTDNTTVPWWSNYVPDTAPIWQVEAPEYSATWRPTPMIPEAFRDTLSAVRAKLSRVLRELNALQGNIGQLTLTQKEKEIEVRYRDTTHYTPPPAVIETPFLEKIGIAAMGGIIMLTVAGIAIILIRKLPF